MTKRFYKVMLGRKSSLAISFGFIRKRLNTGNKRIPSKLKKQAIWISTLVCFSFVNVGQATAKSSRVHEHPSVCIRLPFQAKTKCRVRQIATRNAPQALADELDRHWTSADNQVLVMQSLDLRFASERKKEREAKVQLFEHWRALIILADKFPQYIVPKHLVTILSMRKLVFDCTDKMLCP